MVSDSTAQQEIPTGRIVVLAEMPDGTVRALDGEGSALIEVRTRYADVNPFEPTLPIGVLGRTTTMTIIYDGTWRMYTSQHPEAPPQPEIESSPKEIARD